MTGRVATQLTDGPSNERQVRASTRRSGSTCALARWVPRRLSGGEEAQGVVEFALMATVLLTLFLGAIDYGRWLYYGTAVQSAARVGAETASNHCPFAAGGCGSNPAAVGDAFVQWKTYCEAESYVVLKPTYQSCTAGTSSTWTPTCSSSCTGCTYDICVSPATRSTGTQVTVYVGYSFKPISFLMAPFFADQSCYTGDSTATNHHTICASAVGLVS